MLLVSQGSGFLGLASGGGGRHGISHGGSRKLQVGSLGYIGLLEGFYKVYIDQGSYNWNYPPENVLECRV